MRFAFLLFVAATPLPFFCQYANNGFKNSLCERIVLFGYVFIAIFSNYLNYI